MEQARDGVVGIGRERLDLEAALELVDALAAHPGPLTSTSPRRALHRRRSGRAGPAGPERGAQIRFRGASEDLKRYLRELPLDDIVGADCSAADRGRRVLATAGGGLFAFVAAARYFVALGLELLYWVVLAPFRGVRLRLGKIVTELNRVGVEAIPIVGLIAALMGVILALNSAGQLRVYGAEKLPRISSASR